MYYWLYNPDLITETRADLSYSNEANVHVVCCEGSSMREGPCPTSSVWYLAHNLIDHVS